MFCRSWENVFSDKESGVAYYEWAVGSYPGHADVMPFTREISESGVTDPSRPLTFHEGHSYFISIKVSSTWVYKAFSIHQQKLNVFP